MKCKIKAWQKDFSQSTDQLPDSEQNFLSLHFLLTQVTCKRLCEVHGINKCHWMLKSHLSLLNTNQWFLRVKTEHTSVWVVCVWMNELKLCWSSSNWRHFISLLGNLGISPCLFVHLCVICHNYSVSAQLRYFNAFNLITLQTVYYFLLFFPTFPFPFCISPFLSLWMLPFQ